jgi:hypothetical protein
MPVPTAYTEVGLALYMQSQLRGVATDLGWVLDPTATTIVGTPYEELVYDVLIAYGVTDIVDATDIPKLRCLARVAVWSGVYYESTRSFRWSARGVTYDQGLVHDYALKTLNNVRQCLDSFEVLDLSGLSGECDDCGGS